MNTGRFSRYVRPFFNIKHEIINLSKIKIIKFGHYFFNKLIWLPNHLYNCFCSIQDSNFIKIKLRHECSPVNLLHIFRTPLPKNNSRGLLLSSHVSPKIILFEQSSIIDFSSSRERFTEPKILFYFSIDMLRCLSKTS